MTKIYLAGGSVIKTNASTTIDIKRVINKECGSYCCEDITDEIDCYSWDKDKKKFVEEHKDCTFYQTYDDVVGMWKQPMDLVAVKENCVMTKYVPMINCGYYAGQTPMFWDRHPILFDTEEECEDWICEHEDDFTMNESGGCVYASEIDDVGIEFFKKNFPEIKC